MAQPSPQRSYRAPCPGCGAPVAFYSAQSTHAVCGYCQSTVVRSGEVLERIGKMAELFDDHSPLQLMASGQIVLDGKTQPFTLIGRLQYKSDTGTWTEWNAILSDGSMATLGEDNGAYVFTRNTPAPQNLPDAARFRVGTTTSINGKRFSVATHVQAILLSAQGELPQLPPLGQPFTVVELRSEEGEVLSIDYASTPARMERGHAVQLEALQMQGLKEGSAKEEKGRQFNCPHCGAPVQVKLNHTQSLTCPSCSSIITLDTGVGGQLHHALQNEPVKPLIALGSLGQLEGVEWQVVGFQHRMGQVPDDEEQFGWSEYLLYHQKRGFSFLVDAEDGWSLVRPATGAPQVASSGKTATYLGTKYTLQYSYDAETTYVLGEFYWPVERGQKTLNRDFASAKGLLSMEQTPQEVTWSYGSKLSSDTVAQAFKLDDKKNLLHREDAAPLSGGSRWGCGTLIVIAIILIILLLLLGNCSGSSGGSGRSSGGSFGGFSGGGGHK